MSLDRLQSKPGNLHIEAEPYYTVASSLTTAASNVLPGGYQFGSNFAIAPAVSHSGGGGAQVIKVPTPQTYAASSGTGAMVSHNGMGFVLASLSAGGLHNLQPPSYDGQLLTIINNASGSASFVTGAVLNGQGAGSTTTAVIPTLSLAQTIGGSTGTDFAKQLIGIAAFGGSATNSTNVLWLCTGGATGTKYVFGGSAGELVLAPPMYGQTYAGSSGTGAMVMHGGGAQVFASLSAGGLHNIQPPTYNGQQLTIVNMSNVTGSFVTGAILSGQGTGSTTTVVIPTLTNAFTFGANNTTVTNYTAREMRFVGLSALGGTASNSTYAVWSCLNLG
jgi:hypothetical protein